MSDRNQTTSRPKRKSLPPVPFNQRTTAAENEYQQVLNELNSHIQQVLDSHHSESNKKSMVDWLNNGKEVIKQSNEIQPDFFREKRKFFEGHVNDFMTMHSVNLALPSSTNETPSALGENSVDDFDDTHVNESSASMRVPNDSMPGSHTLNAHIDQLSDVTVGSRASFRELAEANKILQLKLDNLTSVFKEIVLENERLRGVTKNSVSSSILNNDTAPNTSAVSVKLEKHSRENTSMRGVVNSPLLSSKFNNDNATDTHAFSRPFLIKKLDQVAELDHSGEFPNFSLSLPVHMKA